ncbi:MAG TPA: hypothetical protein VNI02_17235, partial [Blastocatellia bacterium]|nr:hypothetical protein [Blastocatellia bacterium]
IASAAADAGVSYFLADMLSLRQSAREYFLPYLRETFPEIAPRYEEIFKGDYLPFDRRREVKKMLQEVAAEYGVDHYDRMMYVPPVIAEPQQRTLEGMDVM